MLPVCPLFGQNRRHWVFLRIAGPSQDYQTCFQTVGSPLNTLSLKALISLISEIAYIHKWRSSRHVDRFSSLNFLYFLTALVGLYTQHTLLF